MNLWEYFISYGSTFSPVLAFIFFQKWKVRYLYGIALFVLISFLTDVLFGFILVGKPNYFILQLYGIFEALLLFLFYGIVLEKSKKWIIVIGIVFTLFYIYDAIWIEPDQFNTIGRSVESFIMIVLSLTLFYQFFRKEDDIFLDKSPLFWINIGILIYFSGALFSFVMSSVILTSKLSWVFHNISNILKNVFIAIGLWRAKVN